MKTSTYLVVLVLAGCATPAELINSDRGNVYKSAQPPIKVAQCLARNADEQRAGIFVTPAPATWRESQDPGAYEMVYLGANGAAIAAARAIPAAEGSSFTIWIGHPHKGKDGVGAWLADRIAAGC